MKKVVGRGYCGACSKHTGWWEVSTDPSVLQCISCKEITTGVPESWKAKRAQPTTPDWFEEALAEAEKEAEADGAIEPRAAAVVEAWRALIDDEGSPLAVVEACRRLFVSEESSPARPDHWLRSLRELRAAGQKEYCHDPKNPLANFERLAAEIGGVTPEQVLLVFAGKHKDGIVAWGQGHKSQREAVTGRALDLAVYMLLLWEMRRRAPKQPKRMRIPVVSEEVAPPPGVPPLDCDRVLNVESWGLRQLKEARARACRAGQQAGKTDTVSVWGDNLLEKVPRLEAQVVYLRRQLDDAKNQADTLRGLLDKANQKASAAQCEPTACQRAKEKLESLLKRSEANNADLDRVVQKLLVEQKGYLEANHRLAVGAHDRIRNLREALEIAAEDFESLGACDSVDEVRAALRRDDKASK